MDIDPQGQPGFFETAFKLAAEHPFIVLIERPKMMGELNKD